MLLALPDKRRRQLVLKTFRGGRAEVTFGQTVFLARTQIGSDTKLNTLLHLKLADNFVVDSC